MTSDRAPDPTELAVRFRNEGEVLRKQAAADLEAAQTERAHIERRHHDIAELEKNISRREEHLRQLGEPAFLEREAAAADKLAKAEALMASYQRDKHAAAIALQQIDARERKQSATSGPLL